LPAGALARALLVRKGFFCNMRRLSVCGSRLPCECLEALTVRLWGKPETRFVVFTKTEFSFHGPLYASAAHAR
jgi:hypothetical protein